jgi:DNA-binding response OmpR family regulator
MRRPTRRPRRDASGDRRKGRARTSGGEQLVHPDGTSAELTSILVAEDDESFGRELIATLAEYGMTAGLVSDWPSLLRALESVSVDVLLLDQRLGSFDALTGLAHLRSLSVARIVIITGNPVEEDRIVGLELGADDVLRKPISGREMVARVRAHMRRPSQQGGGPRQKARWTLAGRERRVYSPDGQPLPLTDLEFNLLSRLMTEPGVPVGRDKLSSLVFGRESGRADRAVDSLVHRVRLKLLAHGSTAIIATSRGKGYSFIDLS